MTTILSAKRTTGGWRAAAWLPLVTLPPAVALAAVDRPAWVRMWAVAVALYGSLKWLTFVTSDAARRSTFGKAAGYLLLWTGMDAEKFFSEHRRQGTIVSIRDWLAALAMIGVGAWILIGLAPRVAPSWPMIAGWLTMMGVVAIIHCGVSRLLAHGWRLAGVNAQELMHRPLLARSLADFWGRRWNVACRDLAHRFVFQPLAGRVGLAWATMAVFFVSGLVHDAVISLAAGGGWGLPTAYFLIQGVALLIERSRLGKRSGLGRGIAGRLFAAAVIIGPVGLLFHRPFATRVAVPMLEAIQHVLL
jgi:hypothetical protein